MALFLELWNAGLAVGMAFAFFGHCVRYSAYLRGETDLKLRVFFTELFLTLGASVLATWYCLLEAHLSLWWTAAGNVVVGYTGAVLVEEFKDIALRRLRQKLGVGTQGGDDGEVL